MTTQPPVSNTSLPAVRDDLRAARGRATKTRLLSEALRLFAERGYEGVSTRAVAQAAESNVALIAFHFGSKRGLYEAAVEAVARRTAEAISPAEENLRRGITEFAGKREELLDLLRSEIIRNYEKYTDRGYCPIYAREPLSHVYEAYHALGGNSTATDLYKKTMALPSDPPSDPSEE